MRPRVLVAGIGNVFLHDDGFGVEVLKELEAAVLPPWVQIADYDLSALRVRYDLLGGYDTTILLDATPHGRAPGTLSLTEANTEDLTTPPEIGAHGLPSAAVLRLLDVLGCDAGRVLVVTCEPACVDGGIGLSPPVRAAVPAAVRAVTELAWGASPELPVAVST